MAAPDARRTGDSRVNPRPNAQRGAALFISLIMLVVITLFVVSAINMSTVNLRITANMYGDHQVYTSMADLFPIGVPAVFLGFGLFVSFIQAFVFTLLTTIYIGLAKPHDDHGHDDEHGHAH